MQVEVKVPQLSESVSEATLVSWHKRAGETVRRDENLIDIETDKVVLELPAPADGVIAKIVKEDGASVSSGELLAVIERGKDNLLHVEEHLSRSTGEESPLEVGAPPAAGGAL